jgi:hypothetical protein
VRRAERARDLKRSKTASPSEHSAIGGPRLQNARVQREARIGADRSGGTECGLRAIVHVAAEDQMKPCRSIMSRGRRSFVRGGRARWCFVTDCETSSPRLADQPKATRHAARPRSGATTAR